MKETVKTASPPNETAPTYEAKELAQNAETLFGYSRDIATAAFAYNHVKRAAIEQARKIIKEFAERKV